jgi:hypothetical protein
MYTGNFVPTFRGNLSVPFQEINNAKRKKMEPIGCPETSVRNYPSMLRKVPHEGRSHLHDGESLESCMVPLCGETTLCHV